jgi:hypothetical protein
MSMVMGVYVGAGMGILLVTWVLLSWIGGKGGEIGEGEGLYTP